MIVAVWLSATDEFVGDVLYYEDFGSGEDSLNVWTNVWNANPAATDDGFVVTGDSAFLITDDFDVQGLSGTSIRTQFAFHGGFSKGIGLFANGDASVPSAYQGGFNPSANRLYLQFNDPLINSFATHDIEFDLSEGNELILQFDVFDHNLSLWAWRPGEPMPLAPQLTYHDPLELGAPGVPGVIFDSGQTSSSATFRYVRVDDVSIPYLTCDADNDRDCDLADLDAMYHRFGVRIEFDFDGDGGTGPEDITGWLSAASSAENTANPDGLSFVTGDVNLDGAVDSGDLGLLLNNFGATALSAGEGVGWGGGDLDGSGSVDSDDLGLLLNDFGHMSATAVAVPEPPCNGWALLFLIVAFLRVGRRMQFQHGACSLFYRQP